MNSNKGTGDEDSSSNGVQLKNNEDTEVDKDKEQLNFKVMSFEDHWNNIKNNDVDFIKSCLTKTEADSGFGGFSYVKFSVNCTQRAEALLHGLANLFRLVNNQKFDCASDNVLYEEFLTEKERIENTFTKLIAQHKILNEFYKSVDKGLNSIYIDRITITDSMFKTWLSSLIINLHAHINIKKDSLKDYSAQKYFAPSILPKEDPFESAFLSIVKSIHALDEMKTDGNWHLLKLVHNNSENIANNFKTILNPSRYKLDTIKNGIITLLNSVGLMKDKRVEEFKKTLLG